jgi:phosphatidate phosphatase APP1
MDVRRWALAIERSWDARRLRRRAHLPPESFRIEAYVGFGGPGGVVVGGRVLDDPPQSEAVDGEGVGPAVRRSIGQFFTHDLPDVPLRVTVGDTSVETVTDDDGYFLVRLDPTGPVATASVELAADYRGLTDRHTTPIQVVTPGPDARFGIISDIDDTILETGVQRVWQMVRTTFAGSVLTRTPFEGAPELYRDLAAGRNPVFYVSSSPWNLYTFLQGFLRHRDFPFGPVLLRDLLGTHEGRARKHERIDLVLALNPDLPFVLAADSDAVRRHAESIGLL